MNESQQKIVFHVAATYGEHKTASTLGVNLDVTSKSIVAPPAGDCEITEKYPLAGANRPQRCKRGRNGRPARTSTAEPGRLVSGITGSATTERPKGLEFEPGEVEEASPTGARNPCTNSENSRSMIDRPTAASDHYDESNCLPRDPGKTTTIPTAPIAMNPAL